MPQTKNKTNQACEQKQTSSIRLWLGIYRLKAFGEQTILCEPNKKKKKPSNKYNEIAWNVFIFIFYYKITILGALSFVCRIRAISLFFSTIAIASADIPLNHKHTTTPLNTCTKANVLSRRWDLDVNNIG